MTYDDFIEIVSNTKKNKPVLFGLESDKVASSEEISQYEETNGIILPDEYKRFVTEFGGGYFGFTTIYLLRNQNSVSSNYLAISDNGCGDYYVLKVIDGTAPVSYTHLDVYKRQVYTIFMQICRLTINARILLAT